jgi:hypothetical protein
MPSTVTGPSTWTTSPGLNPEIAAVFQNRAVTMSV